VPKRAVQRVTDMEIDEISLVDRAANQSASIVFSKRADQEESMPDYLDADGDPLDLSQFEEGDILEDEDGNQFEVSFDDDDGDEDYFDDDYVADDAAQYAEVGKSAFGYSADNRLIASIREELSKAVDEDDRSAVLGKAFSTLAKRAEAAEYRLAQAEDVAKAERDLRLEREYISKAAEYNVPIDPEDLGPVLMRAAEALSYDDCAVLHKALVSAGEMLYTEAGFDGTSAVEDPIDRIDAFLDEQVSKGVKSSAGVMTDFFDDHPEAYDALRSERR
jgi:hypothetical protein